MKRTISMKSAGELACRRLSEKAQTVYNESQPFDVFEYENFEGEKVYAYTGVFGAKDGMTFEELEEDLEDLYDALAECYDEEEDEEE